jgi:dynein heavy chain 2
VEVLKANVASHVAAFQQEAEKFAARWHQLKPKNDTLDADREVVVNAVEFIKTKRLEFDELDQQRRKLVYCFTFLLKSTYKPLLYFIAKIQYGYT